MKNNILLRDKSKIEKFFLALSQAKGALLLLDYDGTLAPFSENPKQAYPYPGVCKKLKQIMTSNITKVVILSGRDLEQLKKLLPIDPLPELWGSHGGERLLANESNPSIKKIDKKIKNLLCKSALEAKSLAPDLYCEIKPLSVALHWRGKDDSAAAQEQSFCVRKRWEKIIEGHALEIHEFDGGIELRIQGINKAEAVKVLLKMTPSETIIAYLGDDLTDEEAFQAIGSRGLKVLVRKEIRPTAADVHLVPPVELFWFLDRWIQSQTKEAL